MEFLGHFINQDGIATLPEKLATMRSYETPRTAKELKALPRHDQLLQVFRTKSAETLKPLCDLIKQLNTLPKNAKIMWSSEQLQALKKSKADLTNASYLAYLEPDESLYLVANTSDTALLQFSIRSLQPSGCNQ